MMSRSWLALLPLFGVALLAAAAPTGADEGKVAAAKGAPTAAEVQMPFFGNDTCPVSGKPVKHDKYAEKDGERIYTCCAKCPKTIDADFAKFKALAYPTDKIVDVKNATCPIGKKPAKDDVTMDWQGHRVHFCCGDCKEKFLKSPNKSLAVALHKDMKVAGNAKCPVSDEEISDTDTFVIYKNTLINLCCTDCFDKFKADPEKYVKAANIVIAPDAKKPEGKDGKDAKQGG